MAKTTQIIEAQLRQLRDDGAQLRQQAAVVLGNLAKLRQAASSAGALSMDSATEALTALAIQEAGPLWLGWGHPEWEGYTGDRAGPVLSHVRAAQLRDADPLPDEQPTADLALLVPMFAARGTILVICDNDSAQAARSTMQSLVLRTALGMPSEARLTLIDPVGLGAAFPFRSGLSRVRPTGRTVADELAEVIEDIRRVNERVIGHAARFAELTADQRAGESFELVAVMDFPKAYGKDPRAVEHLVRVGNAGPRAGRHLLLEVNVDAPLPHDFKFEQFEQATVIDARTGQWIPDPLPDGLRQQRRPAALLTENSSRRVETAIGERLRIWLGVDDEGMPSSHAIIAGQVGSGKSSLLHVLITGLAARYSPRELQLVLIDGKDGIEFEAYRQLPQAQIICLRTLPAMARSVLADYVAEMEERYRLFQAAGAVHLEDYRQKTGKPLPRKLLIVDEYQQLLDGDEERGGLLLSRILEKGRAAGTHVVLASQTFNVRGMPPTAVTHIHTRASLSLAPDYIQAIQVFGAEGKRLIRELAPSGQVVVNDQSGRDGANSRGAVARCLRNEEADTVHEVIREIISATGSAGKPLVLNGRDAAVVTDNPFVVKWFGLPLEPQGLQEVARLPPRKGGFGMEGWSAADRPLGFWLGRRFDVHGHALCALRRAPSQNLMVLGAQVEVRNRMLASGLVALASMIPTASLDLTLVDGLGADMPGGGLLRFACEYLRECGAQVVVADDSSLGTVLAGLENSLGAGNDPSRTRLLVIAEPDYLYSLHGGADRFAQPSGGAAATVRTILSRGPQRGLHSIVTCSGVAAFGTVFSPSREARLFNHRAVQQMNEDESMTLFASLVGARINAQTEHPFAALLVDQIQGTRAGTLFNSYAADPEMSAPQDLPALRLRLSALGKQEAQRVA
jgi:hypothetical protein